MKAYDNYIFDLYGTLVDIHTEENDPLYGKSWRFFMAIMTPIIHRKN